MFFLMKRFCELMGMTYLCTLLGMETAPFALIWPKFAL